MCNLFPAAHALLISNVSGSMVRVNDLSIILSSFFAGRSNLSGRKHFTRKIDSKLAHKPFILDSDACVGLFG